MQLIHPTLLLDEQKCRANIRQMADKANQHHLLLKPHFKTHQSAVIGTWFREAGIKAIEVSSLSMAHHFAAAGWQDITLGFPVNVRAIEEINQLAGQVTLSLFINNPESAHLVGKHLRAPVQVYTEIDTGSYRTGISSEAVQEITALLKTFQPYDLLNFKGFYTHDGHTYQTKRVEEVKRIHQVSVDKMVALKHKLEPVFGPIKICKGDTPACSLAEEHWEGIDEISAGNFVFYDYMQYQLGTCSLDQVAVCMACPVVEKHPERGEVIIHGGAVHFSKEHMMVNGDKSFGQVVTLDGLMWHEPIDGAYLKAISQEHGVLAAPASWLAHIAVGDMVGILPVHSCLTANLMRQYLTTNGEIIHQF